MRHSHQSGFTLIELLVVIAIIGTLASVVLASLNSAREKARDSKRLADIGELNKALQLYWLDNNGEYPPHDAGTQVLTSLTELVPDYMPQLPEDPTRTGNLGYRYCRPSTNRDSYSILIRPESTNQWCMINHQSNHTGSGCWMTSGVPQHGWCNDEL